jgi:hypothetical protein
LYKQGHSNSRFPLLLEEAQLADQNWPLLSSGLFRGRFARFKKVADKYGQFLASRRRW